MNGRNSTAQLCSKESSSAASRATAQGRFQLRIGHTGMACSCMLTGIECPIAYIEDR